MTPRPSVRYEHSVPDPKSENRAPSGTGTGARWAASLWNTPLAAQWADSRTAWREGIREGILEESREAIALPRNSFSKLVSIM